MNYDNMIKLLDTLITDLDHVCTLIEDGADGKALGELHGRISKTERIKTQLLMEQAKEKELQRAVEELEEGWDK